MEIEVGGKIIEVISRNLLKDFATEVGATTYRDPIFQDLLSLEKEEFGPQLIDRVVGMNGRISFNLENVNVDNILQGTENGYAAYELRHICGNPAALAITAFFNGPAPC